MLPAVKTAWEDGPKAFPGEQTPPPTNLFSAFCFMKCSPLGSLRENLSFSCLIRCDLNQRTQSYNSKSTLICKASCAWNTFEKSGQKWSILLHNGFNFRPGIIIDSKSQCIEMRFYVLCEEEAQDLSNLLQLYLIDCCRHYKQKVFRVQSHQNKCW